MPGRRLRKSIDFKEMSDDSDDDDMGGDTEKGDTAGGEAEAAGGEDKEEEEEEFTVEAILNKRTIGGITKYLIKWEGFDETYNTWEPEENLDCQEILEEFERSWKEKRGKAKTGIGKPCPKSVAAANAASNPVPSTSNAAHEHHHTSDDGDDLDHFDDQGKTAASLSIKTNYRRMDLRPQVEGNGKLYGLERGLEPLYIVGTVVNSKGKKFYLVVWCDTDEGDMVPIEDFNAKYPEFALSYFESHRVWLPSIDHYREDEDEAKGEEEKNADEAEEDEEEEEYEEDEDEEEETTVVTGGSSDTAEAVTAA